MSIADSHATDDPTSGDRSVDDRDDVLQLCLERRVEVLGSANGNHAVGVGQLGKDANLIVVLEVGSDDRHGLRELFQLCFK